MMLHENKQRATSSPCQTRPTAGQRAERVAAHSERGKHLPLQTSGSEREVESEAKEGEREREKRESEREREGERGNPVCSFVFKERDGGEPSAVMQQTEAGGKLIVNCFWV